VDGFSTNVVFKEPPSRCRPASRELIDSPFTRAAGGQLKVPFGRWKDILEKRRLSGLRLNSNLLLSDWFTSFVEVDHLNAF